MENRKLIEYIKGDLVDEQEIKSVLNWIEASEGNQKRYTTLKNLWVLSGLNHIYTLRQNQPSFRKQSFLHPQLAKWSKYAAVFLLMLSTGYFVWKYDSTKPQQPFATCYNEIYIPKGEKRQITLPDETKVWLNSGTKLRYPTVFNDFQRKIFLEGEGYFEVESSEKRPFIVKTQNFEVVVTGTKFNVSSYADEKQISTTLYEGSVMLSTSHKQIIQLALGDKISFDPQTMKPSLKKVEIETEPGWIHDELIFDETPFPDLIKRLERQYDITLSYQCTELDSIKYSGSFKNQETIWQALNALKITTPVDYEKTGNKEFELNHLPM